jgi:hypothetical protein
MAQNAGRQLNLIQAIACRTADRIRTLAQRGEL